MQETPDFWVGKICWRRDRLPTPVFLGFPCDSVGRLHLQCGRPGFNPWVGKILWRRERLPTPVFWPGEFHGLYRPRGRKESDMTERLSLSYTHIIFSLVQLLSCVRLFATPWTAACQASTSIINSWSLLKLVSITLVMPSNHLILCRPLLLLPSIFPSIRVFSNESVLQIRWPKYWSFKLQHHSFQ